MNIAHILLLAGAGVGAYALLKSQSKDTPAPSKPTTECPEGTILGADGKCYPIPGGVQYDKPTPTPGAPVDRPCVYTYEEVTPHGRTDRGTYHIGTEGENKQVAERWQADRTTIPVHPQGTTTLRMICDPSQPAGVEIGQKTWSLF